MRTNRVWVHGLLAIGLASLVTVGCALPSAPLTVDRPGTSTETSPPPSPTVIAAPLDEPRSEYKSGVERPDTGNTAAPRRPESPAAAAIADLAQRLGVIADNIVLMSIEEMTLPAADLGCPTAPGSEGAEAAVGSVEGQEITLVLGGKEYVYRAHGWQVVPCRPPLAFSDLPAPQQPGEAGAPLNAAKLDLSDRLGIDADQIQIHSVEAVEWPDASLGCPQPGMMYAQVVTPGYRLYLVANGESYEYHSNHGQAVLCQPE